LTGYERIRAAIAGEWPDSVPMMLDNFMMAAREAGIRAAEFRRDPRALARPSSSRPSATASTALSSIER